MTTVSIIPRKNLIAQEVSVSHGLTVFIGSNGSGKSSMLESLFEQLGSADQFVVAFTSGPNENFTKIYDKLRKPLRWNIEALRSLQTNKLLFDLSWAPFLIPIACFSHSQSSPSRVYTFLKERNYSIKEIKSRIRVPREMLNKISSAAGAETILATAFTEILEKLLDIELPFLEKSTHRKIRFSETASRSISHPSNEVLDSKLYTAILELTEIAASRDALSNTTSRVQQLRKLVSAFSIGNLNDSIFCLNESELVVSRNEAVFTNRDFSDGEYQLLMTLALLDIFDDSNTVFLLDEMDSHVHQKMIPHLWSSFSNTSGSVFTTTHNPTSLKYCESLKVYSLKNGKVVSGREHLEELSNIFDNQESVNKVLALGFRNVPNLVIIDDFKDWSIFIALAKKIMGAEFDSRLESNISVHKVTSGQTTAITDTNPKFAFTTKMKNYFVEELPSLDVNRINLKKVISFFDRDTRDLHGRYVQNQVWRVIHEESVPRTGSQPFPFKSYGISWHRRDIENYLLTSELLESVDGSTVVGSVGTTGIQLTAEQVLGYIQTSNEEAISSVDCKDFINQFICESNTTSSVGHGFSLSKLDDTVLRIQPNSISPYIKAVHNFIVTEIFG